MIGRQACLLLVVLVVLVHGTGVAFADTRCNARMAPVSLSTNETGLDQARDACTSRSLGIALSGLSLVDTGNYYGTLVGSLFLDYHHPLRDRYELSITGRVYDYRFAQSAVFKSTETSIGPVRLELLRSWHASFGGHSSTFAVSLRSDVPWSNRSDESLTISASPGAWASVQLSQQIQLHARVSGLFWGIFPADSSEVRTAALASADAALAPWRPLSILFGVQVQGGWYGPGIDHVQLRGGARLGIWGGNSLELSAAMPVAGADRTDLSLWLGFRRALPGGG